MPTNRPTPYERPGKGKGGRGFHGGKGGKGKGGGAPSRGGSVYDPLDPASWEGYDVPLGGWSRGLATSQGRAAQPGEAASHEATAAAGVTGGPATRPAQAPGKALPSPGDILRMNAAAAGGGNAAAQPK